MGLFGDNEEKQQRKEESREAFIREFLNKYRFEDFSEDDLEVMIQIALQAWKDGWCDKALGNDKEIAIYEQLKAVEAQNWMILNQLNKLNNNFDKLFNR